MTTINNATGLYAKLGYNFDDPNNIIQPLSANIQSEMARIPAFMTEASARTMINGDTTVYFQNPVKTPVQSISNSANSIISICSELNGNIPQTSVCSTLVNACQSYITHTNNISGLTDINAVAQLDQVTYKTAVSVGTLILHLTNQTDGIINTSPILGNFTSLFVGPQLSASANTISIYYNLISNSISTSLDINGNVVATSSLTLDQVNNINTEISNTITFLTTRQLHDQTFFQNSKDIVNAFANCKDLKNFGETEKYLINNFIGTPELINIINT